MHVHVQNTGGYVIMKATFISKDKNTVNFSIEFTSEDFENAIIDAYKANKDRFAIDGFRKGKAPRKLIESHYGEDVFYDDAINNLISQSYPTALDELKLEVVDRPDVDVSEIKKGEGFTATVKVDVYPEFEVKDYKGIETDKIELSTKDEDVDRELDMLRSRNARMINVERPVKDGDTVLVDYAGYVGDNQFEGGTAEKYSLKIGSNTFIPGFEEQLIGTSIGGECDVKVTFPEEYHSEELAGKEAIFKCKVHEIKEEELPALDDDFAKDISEFDTIDELKKEIKDKIEESAKLASENQMKNALIEKVVTANDIDVPNMMIEEEIDNMINAFDHELRSQGMGFEQYLSYIQKDILEFRSELKDEAYKKVKTRMIISKIAEQEDFAITKEDIDAEIEMMAGQYRMEADKVKEILGEKQLQFMEKDLKMKKAVDFIFESAKIK